MSRQVEIDTPIRPAEEAAAQLGVTKRRFLSLVEMVREDMQRNKAANGQIPAKKAAKRAARHK